MKLFKILRSRSVPDPVPPGFHHIYPECAAEKPSHHNMKFTTFWMEICRKCPFKVIQGMKNFQGALIFIQDHPWLLKIKPAFVQDKCGSYGFLVPWNIAETGMERVNTGVELNLVKNAWLLGIKLNQSYIVLGTSLEIKDFWLFLRKNGSFCLWREKAPFSSCCGIYKTLYSNGKFILLSL